MNQSNYTAYSGVAEFVPGAGWFTAFGAVQIPLTAIIASCELHAGSFRALGSFTTARTLGEPKREIAFYCAMPPEEFDRLVAAYTPEESNESGRSKRESETQSELGI